MRFALLFLVGLPALAGVPTGCGGNADAMDNGASDVPGKSGPQAAIAFDDASGGALPLAPGQEHLVAVTTSPPDRYEISFDLLGDALDASLDRASQVADDLGRANVLLRAPSGATTFQLRATVKDGASAELGVSVSEKGFGNVHAVPVYKGKRTYYTEWTTDVVAKTTCAAIAPVLPNDPPGALSVTAPKGKEDDLVVSNAPVGPNLAVAVRAGHFIAGCSDEADLIAGQTLDVPVNVIDEPMDLSKTDLDVTFTFTPDPTPYAQLVDEIASLVAETFLPPSEPEGTTLLDTMQDLSTDSTSFAIARGAGLWDATADLYFATQSLRQTCKELAMQGLGGQAGKLVGHLRAAGPTLGHALLEVSQLGYVDAVSAGIPPEHIMNWSADANDAVLLAGTVYFLPSRFATATMLKPAVMRVPSAPDVATALGALASCDTLATSLGGYAGCDTTCMASLCGAAVAARWTLAVDASASSGITGQIDVQASASAIVDDVAAPASFSGIWKGTLGDGSTTVDLNGTAAGAANASGDTPPQ